MREIGEERGVGRREKQVYLTFLIYFEKMGRKL